MEEGFRIMMEEGFRIMMIHVFALLIGLNLFALFFALDWFCNYKKPIPEIRDIDPDAERWRILIVFLEERAENLLRKSEPFVQVNWKKEGF
jgi:hypothetical protein